MKSSGKIGYFRLLNIKVILDDDSEPIYEGMVDDAPEEIRQLEYARGDMGDPMTLYVYSEEYMARKEANENL